MKTFNPWTRRRTFIALLAVHLFTVFSSSAAPPDLLPPDRYDAENRLIEHHSRVEGRLSRIRFVYDADGNRIEKTVEESDPVSGRARSRSTRFLFDENNLSGYSQTAAELEAGSLARGFLHGLRPVAEIALSNNSPEARYLVSDGQGSTRASVAASSDSTVADQGEDRGSTVVVVYDAFGNLLEALSRESDASPWRSTDPTASPTSLPDHLFAGERFDRDLGMMVLRARDYATSMGVFTTADRFEGFLRDPMSLHRYAYCGGDPLNRIDPSGNASTIAEFTESFNARAMAFVMSVGPAATTVKFGLAALTLSAAIHDPGSFVAAFESPMVAANLVAMDLGFVAYYGPRLANFVTGYGALRMSIRPKVEGVLAEAAERVKQLDRNAIIGFRGSTARGYKGPQKNSDPFDPSAFDVDAFIVSDQLAAGIPKINGARFPRENSSASLVLEQKSVDQALRPILPGLKKSPFSFRIYTFDEFNKRRNDNRVILGEE